VATTPNTASQARMPTFDVRRADQRFSTQLGWLDSKHSFSFGHHRDPRNTHFGLLLVSNDDRVAPDTGFDTHPHRDMEIVTWVLDGELDRGGLVPVASGRGDDAGIAIRQQHARLLAGRLQAGEVVDLPDAPFVHLFVARGDVHLDGAGPLVEGDAVRLTAADGPRVTAGDGGAEVLAWEMHAALA